MTHVSICVLSYDGRDVLRECLTQVVTQVGPYSRDVVVTDNGSNDGTADMVRAEFPDVALIQNPVNQAFTKPFNRMVRETQGQLLFIISNDVKLHRPNTLATLVAFLEANPGAAAVVPKSVKPSGALERVAKREPTYASLLSDWTFLGPLLRARPRAPEYNLTSAQEVEVAQDSCILIRRAALAEGQPFDESLRLYYTEDDLCKSLRAGGWTIHYLPQASVTHLHQYTMRRVKPLKHKWLYTRDMLVYARKHLGAARSTLILAPLAVLTFALRLPRWAWKRQRRR